MISERDVESMFSEMEVGEAKRILHEGCSEGKDACLNITKTKTGLSYYCHRCQDGGTKRVGGLSPAEIAKNMKRIENARKIESQKASVTHHDVVSLPTDCVRLVILDKWNTDQIPSAAMHWFWKYGWLTPHDIVFEVYWSSSTRRVIFPIRDRRGLLIGWVGRDVEGIGSKYRTEKQNDVERLLYITPGTEKHVVYTEDILSARKVYEATGHTAVALLTTHIDLNVVERMASEGGQHYLWLDGDMLKKSVKRVMRITSLGYRIKSIRTELDPKCYSHDDIRKHINYKEDL